MNWYALYKETARRAELTPEEESVILNWYKKGRYSVADIARTFDIPSSSVFDVLKRNNVEYRRGFFTQDYWPRDNPLTDKNRARIVNMYEQGNRPIDIARKFDISLVTLYRILKQYNVGVKHQRAVVSLELEEKIIGDYNKGWDQQHLAEKYNVSRATVGNILNRHPEVEKRRRTNWYERAASVF